MSSNNGGVAKPLIADYFVARYSSCPFAARQFHGAIDAESAHSPSWSDLADLAEVVCVRICGALPGNHTNSRLR
jgi:hypothetical protein